MLLNSAVIYIGNQNYSCSSNLNESAHSCGLNNSHASCPPIYMRLQNKWWFSLIWHDVGIPLKTKKKDVGIPNKLNTNLLCLANSVGF